MTMTMAVRIRPEIVGRGYFAVSRYFLFFFLFFFFSPSFSLSPLRCLSFQHFSPHSSQRDRVAAFLGTGPGLYFEPSRVPVEPAGASDRSGWPAGGDDDLDPRVLMCIRPVSMVDPCESLNCSFSIE